MFFALILTMHILITLHNFNVLRWLGHIIACLLYVARVLNLWWFSLFMLSKLCGLIWYLSWTLSWNLIVRCTHLVYFQMLVWLLVFPRECHFRHVQSSHVLSHLLKHKPYCIVYFDIFFRYITQFCAGMKSFFWFLCDISVDCI